nr:MAG TPA: hypothetical protein [Caudoviricetes sp.]
MTKTTNKIAIISGARLYRAFVPEEKINPTKWQQPLSRKPGPPRPIDGLVYLSHRRRK